MHSSAFIAAVDNAEAFNKHVARAVDVAARQLQHGKAVVDGGGIGDVAARQTATKHGACAVDAAEMELGVAVGVVGRAGSPRGRGPPPPDHPNAPYPPPRDGGPPPQRDGPPPLRQQQQAPPQQQQQQEACWSGDGV